MGNNTNLGKMIGFEPKTSYGGNANAPQIFFNQAQSNLTNINIKKKQHSVIVKKSANTPQPTDKAKATIEDDDRR